LPLRAHPLARACRIRGGPAWREYDRAAMRVCEVTAFGGPEVVRPGQRPWPVAAPGEVVVEIAAANINPTDLAARAGAHRHRMPDLQPPFVPGWDLAGTVVELGEGADGFATGDAVVGMIPWVRIGGRVGACAEAAAVEPSWLAPRPPELDVVRGATVPLNALTAHQALELIAAPPGARVLITGASGAVGSFATQLAARAGLYVIAMASHGDEDWVAGLGADEVIGRDADLAALAPVDAVLDAVPIGARGVAPVRAGGVAVFTRRVSDLPADRELRVEAPLVHTDPVALASLTAAVAEGRLRTRIAHTFDLAAAGQAHRLVEHGGLRGKVVLITH
jgi:NADPH:quinone reductase-like Zn-dependent oxidoreductase